MIRKHPDADFLMEYATGSLSLAPCISITTHLAYCEKCQGTVDSLKEIGGSLLASTEDQPVSNGLLHRVLDCIESEEEVPTKEKVLHSSDELAGALPAFVQTLLPEGELTWRKLSSSVRVAPLRVGEQQFELALHRIKTGGQTPHHDHRGREITVVLKGSFSDEDGLYQPGDFIVREPGDTHQPSAALNEECICLSVLEAPIRLTGMKRVLNPFISFSPS